MIYLKLIVLAPLMLLMGIAMTTTTVLALVIGKVMEL